jgi:diadenosine tetraphosphate (Ap4A) HIT family hydrolase
MGQLDTARVVGCELCMQDGGVLVVRTDQLRVIRARDADHPAFYRVIWADHVAEWTDLQPSERAVMMAAVEAVERTLRQHLQPTKVNLATLGNVVPHLHWHVIARFDWDARWPAPVWAALQREVADAEQKLALPLAQLDALVAQAVLTSAIKPGLSA